MPKRIPERITDHVAEWVFHSAYLDDDEVVWYDVAFQAFPDDEGRFFGQIAIYLQISGPTEGTHVFATPILRPHGLTEQLVTDVVKQALTDMVAERERSKSLTPET